MDCIVQLKRAGLIPPERRHFFLKSKKMNDLISLAEKYPNLNITVRLVDLTEMAKFTVLETKRQIEQTLADASAETYLSPTKTAEMLDVDPSTLFRWRKRNFLNHVEIGGKRKYRMSDIKRILEGGKPCQ